MIGNVSMMISNNADIDQELLKDIDAKEEQGQTILLMALSGKIVLYIQLDNKSNLRPEARQVVKYL